MNFGKLKAMVRGLINRKDFTDALAGDFVNRAISECQRIARLTSNELLLVADGWDGTVNTIMVPGNYLELSEIFTDDGPLDYVTKSTFFDTCTDGPPQVYMRVGDRWMVRPTPQVGSRLYVQYFGDSPELIDDTDTNTWAKAGFNAVLYTAASQAADYFQMEDAYVQRFQGRSESYMQTILAQEYDDRWSGTHVMAPAQNQGDY